MLNEPRLIDWGKGSFLRIAVCEDDPGDAEALRALIGGEEGGVNGEVGTEAPVVTFFSSGEDFLASNPAGAYDLVFMDIYFGAGAEAADAMTGVETAKALRDADEHVEIVFTTTSDGHALDAYRLNAAQYLVKPLSGADVEKMLRLAARKAQASQKVCSVVVDRKKTDILLRHIVYVEALNFRCLIHTTDETVSVTSSMDELQKQLDSPSFFRCHKSYIVNFRYVKDIGEKFTMKNGDVVYMRRRGVKEISDAYKTWLAGALRRNEI
ncbi:DNA-binding response regulator [Synergistales bacterium]|nr:DNA-binding response regulator [Synergistales bacterium]